MKFITSRFWTLLTAATLSLVTTMAGASPGFGEDVFTIRAGGYFSDFDTKVRLSGPNGGDRVNLEDALGLNSNQTVFRGDMSWRFAPRHRVVVEYVDFRREATGNAERSFVSRP